MAQAAAQRSNTERSTEHTLPAKSQIMSDTPLRTPTLLSLVAPVYNEEELVEQFVARATAAIADYEFELVLVNDGSSDRTPELLDRIRATACRRRRRRDDRRRPAGPARADTRDARQVEPGRRRGLRGAQAARGRDRLQACHRVLVLQAVRQAR